MGADTDEAASALSELSWARSPDGNIDMKETEKKVLGGREMGVDWLVSFYLAASLAQSECSKIAARLPGTFRRKERLQRTHTHT